MNETEKKKPILIRFDCQYRHSTTQYTKVFFGYIVSENEVHELNPGRQPTVHLQTKNDPNPNRTFTARPYEHNRDHGYLKSLSTIVGTARRRMPKAESNLARARAEVTLLQDYLAPIAPLILEAQLMSKRLRKQKKKTTT